MKVSPFFTSPSHISNEDSKDITSKRPFQNEVKNEEEEENFEAPKISSLKIHLLVVRAAIRLKRIGEKIQIYGTSSKLFDISTRNRQSVKNFLYPLDINFEENKNLDAEKGKINFFVLDPNGIILNFWSPFSMILLIYTATIMPFRLVFYDNDNDFSDPWNVIELLIDIGFWVDFVINMLSCYYDEEGTLVKDQIKIFKHYIKSWFLLDLFACLPFDEIFNAIQLTDETNSSGKKIQLVRLSKLPRIYRIIKIAKIFKIFRFISERNKYFDHFDINSGIMRLLSLLITILLIVHLIGCFWYYEAKIDEFGPDTWVFRYLIIFDFCFILLFANCKL
jgi:Ion transport protein